MDTVSATMAVQWTQCLLHWQYNGHSVCYTGGTMYTVSATLEIQWTQCLLPHMWLTVHILFSFFLVATKIPVFSCPCVGGPDLNNKMF